MTADEETQLLLSKEEELQKLKEEYKAKWSKVLKKQGEILTKIREATDSVMYNLHVWEGAEVDKIGEDLTLMITEWRELCRGVEPVK